MKVVVIDGQGGKLGRSVIERLRAACRDIEIIAVGTNALATSAMLNAGADAGASGENAVVVNVRDADAVIGPVGIIAADSLYGEVTPAMAAAVAQCRARKILIPVNKCNLFIAGIRDVPVSELVRLAVEELM